MEQVGFLEEGSKMAKNNNFLITKPEIKFWLAIITIIVSGAIAFNNLKNQVNAMYEKGVVLREEVESSYDILIEVRDSVIRMEKDVEFIKENIK